MKQDFPNDPYMTTAIQNFHGFGKLLKWGIIIVVILLAGMAKFLV
jgi:hypothetical protein